VVLKLIALVVAAYAGVSGALFVGQEQILFPRRAGGAQAPAPSGWALEPITVTARDGVTLRGHLARPPGPPAPLLLYYGGNAEWVGAQAAGAAAWGRRAVLLMDYRGYGASEGSPAESDLVADALTVYDSVTRRPDVDGEHVALFGRSLGTGVAVQVASQRPVEALVLVTPYDSVRAIAEARYPVLPVGALLRHPFDSLSRASALRMPALFLVGEADTVIPPAHAWRLADAWAGPVERVSFPGRGHNDLVVEPGYTQAIAAFLGRHHGKPVRESSDSRPAP
jgi:pimeloyl-ACP methyl ester carboxylesterase